MFKKGLYLMTACLISLFWCSLAIASPINAPGFTDCASCHSEAAFAVNPITRSTQCRACHSLEHAYLYDKNYPQVNVFGRGWFTSETAWQASPDVLHQAHQGNNQFANREGCKNCHQVASCTACHDNVGHGNHSQTGGSSLPPYSAPTFPQANGSTVSNLKMSCAAAECHQTMPNVVRINADNTALCSNCHTAGGHNHTVGLTGFDPNPGVTCQNCHGTNADKTAELVTVHQKAANAGKIPNFGCNTCHNSTFGGANGVIGDKQLDMSLNGQPIYCSYCHDGVRAHAVNHQPDHLSSSNENVTCNQCHNGTTVSGSFNAPMGVATDVSNSAIHADCDKCHASNNPSVQGFIGANLGVTNPPYLCSNCHDFIAPTHNKMHSVNSFLNAGNGDCGNCHSTDVTVTHAKAFNQCDVCHGANPTLANTKSVIGANLSNNLNRTGYTCQSCHTNAGAHTHPVVANGYDDAPSVSCQNCHATGPNGTGELVKIHQDAAEAGKIVNFSCSICHNSTYEGNGKAIPLDGSLDMKKNGAALIYCDACHNGSNLPAIQHQPDHKSTGDDQVTCSVCHNGTNAKGNFNAPNGTAVDVSGTSIHSDCNKCHASSNPTVTNFINSNKGKVNATYACTECHQAIAPKHNPVHDVKTFMNTGDSNCATCHNKDITVTHNKAAAKCDVCHSTNPTLANTKPTILANLSSNAARTGFTCQTCHTNAGEHTHNVPATFYEPSPAVDCSGCHATNATTKTTELVAVHQKGLGTAFNCAICHNSNFEGPGKVIGKDGVIDMKQNGSLPIYCNSCHNGLAGMAPLKDTGHAPEHKALQNNTMDCASCHSFSLPAGTAKDFTSIHSNGCNTCHSSSVRNDVSLFISGRVGLNNPVYNCEDCHPGLHSGWEVKHQPTLPAVDCKSCHNNDLTIEHKKAINNSGANTAIGYKVLRASASTGPWQEIGKTTATSYTDSGRTANTNYYYKVQAYDGKPNYSPETGVVSVKSLSASATATTSNPNSAAYASGNNGDSAQDPSSTTNALSNLTDNRTGTYYTIRENGTSDQYVFVQLTQDAKAYSKVELKLSVRYYNGTNLTVYPYSNNNTINTNATYTVAGPSRSSSSSYITETIDVTKAAKAMEGLGWMKFRIKPSSSKSASVYLANVQLVVTPNAAPGGTATNPSGALPATPNDPYAPTAPTNLAGTSPYYDWVTLNWTAATDTTVVSSESCSVCHTATAPQKVKDAVTNNNANCSACHTVHSIDFTSLHLAPSYGSTQWACDKCHSKSLNVEHASRGLDCNVCHSSSKAKVKAAIASGIADNSNMNCTVCHTGTADGAGAIHSTLNAAHLTGIFPTATDATCLGCHTTEKAEFVSTKGAYHAANGLTSKADSRGTYISPWTYNATVGCKGCHGSDGTSATSAYANILKRPYTSTSNSGQANMLCFMCHNRSAYGGGDDKNGSSGFSDGSNLHNIGDHKDNNVLQCSWCHSNKPHSTTKAHLIVVKGEPNSTGNLLTSYTHASPGRYQESSCGSTVSACDEHD